jgi:DNA-binding Xre family transcriptional regulator
LASIKEMKEKRIKINKKSLAEYSGISRPTVHKYWDEIQKEINKQ